MQDNIYATSTSSSSVGAGAGKKNKGMAIGMAICAVLALAGVGFGVYGMVQANNKTVSSADLEVQVKNEDGTVTTLETEKVETKTEDGKVVTIVDTPVVSTKNRVYEQPQWVETIYGGGDNSYREELSISVYNGKITGCSITKKEYSSNGGSVGRGYSTCTIDIQGEISRMVEGGLGQSYLGSFVFFIMTDGTVYYIQPQAISQTGDWTAKKFEIGDFITDAFLSVGGNGADTVFITNTGNPILLSSFPEMVELTRTRVQ